MLKKLLFVFLLSPLFIQAQRTSPNSKLFSQAIKKNIRKYRRESRLAHFKKDEERVKFLFDSLIKHVVNGKTVDNFKFRKFSRKRIDLYTFEKPIYLITYASWCVPGEGEIPALNDIANENHNEMDFVVLFWGPKRKIRQFKRKYNRNITVLYIDEKENKHDFAIRSMKHSVGFPTTFFIDESKRILDIRRNFVHHYSEEYSNSYNSNFQSFTRGVSLLKQGTVVKPTTFTD